MKLIEALNHQGRPFEIPDCSRDDLPAFFVEMGFTTGAEVGVERGEFSKKLCEVGLTLYSIDRWDKESDFQKTKETLASFPKNKMIKKASMDAIADFPDNSLDFVYIDANHEFRYVAEDLVEWTRKVKKGGIVAGHDYFFPRNDSGNNRWHVGHVLKAYTDAYNIKNWYVLGSNRPASGEKRDKWRSFMFVKI